MSMQPANNDPRASTERLLLAIKEARQKLEEVERARREPIAVIGMGCRFPGGADNPAAYWELLRSGRDAICEVPATRWDVDAFYSPDPNAVGKMYTRSAAFLRGPVDGFDPHFFGISPREAASLDPQQRLLLEVTWEALEHAGQSPAELLGSRTGVFLGIGRDDYLNLIAPGGFLSEELGLYGGTGNGYPFASGRISYLLGLHGPNLALDTACSSSLVAVHLALASLRARECELALVGGVQLMLSPAPTIALSRLGALAPDGRSKAFDAAADGFGRGEGCGVVVLKRLSDALAAGDPILALLRGSAVNHDGHSSGLTVPSEQAQEQLLRHALHQAQLEPDAVHYLEAHGTGTKLGDPIELGALGAVFGRKRSHPLCIGSVKANIGHLEAAAGIASLIKVVLALAHDELPPQPHYTTPNPHADWSGISAEILTRPAAWPVAGAARLAGVSSFGMGGTNAHVLVGAAPPAPPRAKVAERSAHILTLRAKSAPALRSLASAYKSHLAATAEELADICYTANTGRAPFAHRLAVTGSSPTAMRDGLAAFLSGEECGAVVHGQGSLNERPKLAFLFTGQGAQYVNMGRQLYESQPTFRQAMDRCAELLAGALSPPLLSILYPQDAVPQPGAAEQPAPAKRLEQTAYTQPALFALEYSLAQLWLAWGVQPDFVMGHSVGEYVAACLAGVFSLEDGLKLIAARGRLMQALPADGAMLAVMASAAQVEPLLRQKDAAGRESRVEIAAYNGPSRVVLSGPREQVDSIALRLQQQGIKSRALAVSHAFHSSLMEPMLAQFEAVARTVRYAAPQRAVVSNVTGEICSDAIATPEYWVRHARQPVQFAAGMQTLRRAGATCHLEIGPRPALLALARECLGEGVYVPSLRPDRADWEQLLAALGALYVHGVAVDWRRLDAGTPRRKVQLPTYPFQRERYWVQAGAAATPQLQSRSADGRAPHPYPHPLLGRRQLMALKPREYVFEATLSASAPSYLAEHRVGGQVLFPAAAYIEMALAAGRTYAKANLPQLRDTNALTVEQLTLSKALVLSDSERIVAQLVLIPGQADAAGAGFQIFSRTETTDPGRDVEWTLHASGRLVQGDVGLPSEDQLMPPEHCRFDEPATRQPLAAHYQSMQARGIAYGPAFQGVEELFTQDRAAWGRVRLPPTTDAQPYVLHPLLLDGCFQLVAALVPSDGATYLPVACARVVLYRSPQLQVWANVMPEDAARPDELRFNLAIFDAGGPCARINGLTIRRIESGQTIERAVWRDWLYELAWRPQPNFLPPDTLPQPSEILAPTLRAPLMPAARLADAESLIAPLEQASVRYITEALCALGWRLQPGQRIAAERLSADAAVSAPALADQLGIAPRHRALWSRLLAILAEAGYLQPEEAGWTVRRALSEPAPEPAQAPSVALRAHAEFVLLDRCGASLAAALQGSTDPLSLLFPGGDLSTTAAIYQHSGMAQLANTLAQKAVQSVVQALPRERGLRILEIGAGTGGTTAYLLPHLAADRTRYVFTDISPHFLTQAQARFGAYDFLQYQTLDIEREPLAQGLSEHGYDLIVASNVLHATRDLRMTLRHVRKLLAPSGLLVLVEATRRRRWVDLTFGLTDGWWRFVDQPLRTDHPLLGAEAWRALLLSAGFSAAQTLTPSETLGQTVVVAQSSRMPVALARPWLIFADAGGLGEKLARQLTAGGERPTLVYRRGVDRPDDFRNGVSADSHVIDGESADSHHALAATSWHSVVYLWSLDQPDALATADDLAVDPVALSQRHIAPVLQLVQALTRGARAPRLWLVTQGAVACRDAESAAPDIPRDGLFQAELWGLGRVIALEHPELLCTLIDLDPNPERGGKPGRSEGGRGHEVRLLTELLEPSVEQQVAFRGALRQVCRLAELEELSSRGPVALEISQAPSERGAIDALRLRPTTRRPPRGGEVEVRVRAAGLNFRDVLNVLDLYGSSPPLGGECAGEVVAVGQGVTEFAVGDTVVALALRSFAEYVTVDARLVAKMPELPFAAAATLPTAFVTAAICLQVHARLRPGERLLVHAGAGGVGQAVIQLAQRSAAELYVTASRDKWHDLRAMGVQNLYDSRSLDFADAIRADTKDLPRGPGVDVIVNSLTGAGFIAKSLSAVVRDAGGRFIEIAQRDIWTAEQMAAARPDVAYTIVNAAALIEQQPRVVGELLRGLVTQVASGTLRPLPHKVFPITQAVRAFRTMQQARHVGKLVLRLPDRPIPAEQAPPDADDQALAFRPDASYLITGGLGGLGLLVAEWLVEKGARQLVLVGRSAPDSQAQATLARLGATGASIVIERADISQRSQVAALLGRLRAPLRGIIHAAGVLDDGVLRRQSFARFAGVLSPKVQGAWNLHALTASMPLDFFVLFSSAASLLGNAGQANHASANAFLDALAHHRRARGLPALSINWGAWSEVGAAAQRTALLQRLEGVISPAQGLAVLHHVMSGTAAQVGVVPLDRQRRVREGVLFSELALVETNQQTGFLAQLAAAPPHAKRGLLAEHVCHTVAKVLGLRGAVPRTEGFFDLGMDSLTSVELRNRLQKTLGCELQSSVTFDYPTIAALTGHLAAQLLPEEQTASSADSPVSPTAHVDAPVGGEKSALPVDTSSDADTDVDSLSADEIALRLAAKLGLELAVP